MANEFAHDKMCALWEETAETTGNKQTFSKDLEVYNMSDMADKDRASDSSDNSNTGGSDREYIPQEYRFNVQDGIVSTAADFQDIVDRFIPVNRGKAKRILAQIDAKGLRSPQRRSEVAKGFARDIANAIDLDCYQTAINQSTMCIRNTTAFDYQAAIDGEVAMLNYGLGGYDKKAFLSNTDYAQVAKDLGNKDFYANNAPVTAFEKAQIPNLATFSTMRSDYRLSLPLSSAAGVTVNGAQEHTVATYDAANEFFLDNRSMTLNLTGATTANMPVGTKFTIAGVNYIDPETKQDSDELLTLTVITASNGAPVVQPAIVATGPYRNASAPAANAAAVVVLNTANSAPSLFYTPEAMRIIPGRLPLPSDAAGVTGIEAVTEQGLPMRLTYEYDFHAEVFNMKALVYYDRQVIYPNQMGCWLSNQ